MFVQGDGTSCLADYCGVFRCDVHSRRRKPEYWDLALCKELDLQKRRAKCQVSFSAFSSCKFASVFQCCVHGTVCLFQVLLTSCLSPNLNVTSSQLYSKFLFCVHTACLACPCVCRQLVYGNAQSKDLICWFRSSPLCRISGAVEDRLCNFLTCSKYWERHDAEVCAKHVSHCDFGAFITRERK